jgi:hypothetical protein
MLPSFVYIVVFHPEEAPSLQLKLFQKRSHVVASKAELCFQTYNHAINFCTRSLIFETKCRYTKYSVPWCTLFHGLHEEPRFTDHTALPFGLQIEKYAEQNVEGYESQLQL